MRPHSTTDSHNRNKATSLTSCHGCGYNLAGLPIEGNCPECNIVYYRGTPESSRFDLFRPTSVSLQLVFSIISAATLITLFVYVFSSFDLLSLIVFGVLIFTPMLIGLLSFSFSGSRVLSVTIDWEHRAVILERSRRSTVLRRPKHVDIVRIPFEDVLEIADTSTRHHPQCRLRTASMSIKLPCSSNTSDSEGPGLWLVAIAREQSDSENKEFAELLLRRSGRLKYLEDQAAS